MECKKCMGTGQLLDFEAGDAQAFSHLIPCPDCAGPDCERVIGGQGRSQEEVRASAMAFFVLLFLASMVVCAALFFTSDGPPGVPIGVPTPGTSELNQSEPGGPVIEHDDPFGAGSLSTERRDREE